MTIEERAHELCSRLVLAGDSLPDRLRRDIMSLGDAAVPALVQVQMSDGPAAADGWPAIHAARLLATLHAAEAARSRR